MSKHMPTNCRIVHMAGSSLGCISFPVASHFSRDGQQRKQPNSLLTSLAGQEQPNVM